MNNYDIVLTLAIYVYTIPIYKIQYSRRLLLVSGTCTTINVLHIKMHAHVTKIDHTAHTCNAASWMADQFLLQVPMMTSVG